MRVHLDPVRWRLAQFRRFRVSKYFGTEVDDVSSRTQRRSDYSRHARSLRGHRPADLGPLPGVWPGDLEGLPAAHVLCTVVCTGVITGGIVHPPSPVPPPIVKGSMTVF